MPALTLIDPTATTSMTPPATNISVVQFPRKFPVARTREGKRAATLYLEPEALKQLQFVALDEGASLQSLLIEGVNAVFEKRGKPRIA
jgi:hypothetical protein